STYGSVKGAMVELLEEGKDVAHVHLRYLNPMPRNLEELLKNHQYVLIPEINDGQLIRIIRDRYLTPAVGLNKIKGLPFSTGEIKIKINELLNS
ncbi:MAG: 2-oxoglutarate ferredoxin oxidoreductase subunit alpha, partial [Ignavibacteria bacterium]